MTAFLGWQSANTKSSLRFPPDILRVGLFQSFAMALEISLEPTPDVVQLKTAPKDAPLHPVFFDLHTGISVPLGQFGSPKICE